MAVEVIMPALGMVQDMGVVISWLKSEGDKVEQGEPLMEVETDKATVEIEAPATGTVAKILAKEDEAVPVGHVVALIAEPGEDIVDAPIAPDVSDESGLTEGSEPSVQEALNVSPVAKRLAEKHGIDISKIPAHGNRITKEDVTLFIESQQKENRTVSKRIPVSPKARRLMKELGISIEEIQGTGVNGAVLAADVLAVAEREKTAQVGEGRVEPEITETPEAASVARELPMSTIWQVMAEHTAKSWTSIPHFYLMRELDVSRFVEWRDSVLDRAKVKVTFSDLLVKVVALALRRLPRVNVVWENGRLLQNDEVNVGLAVTTEEGLVVPVVRNADQMSVGQIAAVRLELVERARKRRLRPEDIGNGSLTISNLGMYGIDSFSALINAPEPAILAVGKIKDSVVAVNGEVAIRPIMTVTLSCDHRVIDGVLGALFLKIIAEMIEDPLSILD